MIVLGLTGSIGMGKSTTAKMFADAGIPVHDADATVHALYTGGPLVEAIEKRFPGTTNEQGVDRKKLGSAVLGDREKITQLEKLVHPHVRAAEQDFLEANKAADKKLVVLDIPLLFETGGEARVDKVLVVTAPASVQRQRVLSRSSMTEEEFEKVLARQMPDREKRLKADFLIDTSKGMDHARHAVQNIISTLTNPAKSS